MAKKGGSRHMKRLASPKYMKLDRKLTKFVAKPNPGRHTLHTSIALSTFIKDKLRVAGTSREAERIIKGAMIQVNGKPIREPRYPIGFGDMIRLVPNEESYIVTIGRHGVFETKKVEDRDQKRTLKIIGKYIARGGKRMVRLSNGDTMHTDKEARVNDSVVLENNRIVELIEFKEGARCMVIKGLHAQETGTIKEITKGTALRDATAKIEGRAGEFETLRENVIAVGA